MPYRKKKHPWLMLLPAFLLFAAAVWTVYTLWPVIRQLTASIQNPATLERFTVWVDSFGPAGIVVLFCLQVLQIVVAFLPGGGIELVGGMLYGTAVSVAISLSGIAVGTFLVIRLCRRYGAPFVKKMFRDEAAFERYQKLSADPRFRSMTVLLFLMPGIPKDVLTYAIGLSGNLTTRYVVVLTLARIPSVVVSAFAGSAFGNGDFGRFGMLYLLLGLIALVGMQLRRRVIDPKPSDGAPSEENGKS